jgi:hypothetical protein
VGGSTNTVDFNLNYVTSLTIDGNRWELGKAFLLISGADSHSVVMITNVSLGSYIPSTAEYMMQAGQNCTIMVDGLTCYKEGGTGYTGPIVNLYADGAGIGSFFMRGGAVMASGADLVNVANAAKWKVSIKNVGRFTTGFVTTTHFTNVDT